MSRPTATLRVLLFRAVLNVAAVYLAARGRGAATLSTALNSNTLNVVIGLFIPAAVIGLGRPSGQTILTAVWYTGLSAVILAFAYRDRGIRRVIGILVIAAYGVFVGSVLGLAYAGPQAVHGTIVAGLIVAVVFAVWLAMGPRPDSGNKEPGPARGSLLAGWPVRRLWILGLAISFIVAAIDATLGNRVVLIGLLTAGPCCVLLTGRWIPTALTGVWVIGLAAALGIPDGIWGTAIHFTWLSAVAAVALASTVAATVIQGRRTRSGLPG